MRRQTRFLAVSQIFLLSVWSLPTWAQLPWEQSLKDELIALEKKCPWHGPWQGETSMVVRANCLNAVDAPIIKTKAPILMQPFETFFSRRILLAQKYDGEIARSVEAWNRFQQGLKEAEAVLASHEPRWAAGQESSLNKDLKAADPLTVCTPQKKTEVSRLKCLDSIVRPIWEREAPETLKYYDEIQKRRIQLATQFDSVRVTKASALADEHLNKGFREATGQLISDSQQAIQEKQAVDAQSAIEQAREREQLLNFVGAFTQVLLQGVAAAAQARANAHFPSLNSAQDTNIIIQNSGVSPFNNRPICSAYCQLMIQSGHVTANDPCAVQCAH